MGLYFTPYQNSVTRFSEANMNAPLIELDKAIGYLKNVVITSSSPVLWDSSTGTLSWASALNVFFVSDTTQQTRKNIINAGSIVLGSLQAATINIVEIDNSVISVAAETLTSGGTLQSPSSKIFLACNSSANNVLTSMALHFSESEVALTYLSPRVTAISFAATMNIDFDTTDVANITLTDNATINATGGVDGQKLVLRLRQDATGSRLVTWGTMFRFSADVAEPVLSTGASALDRIGFEYCSADAKYDCVAVNKGF